MKLYDLPVISDESVVCHWMQRPNAQPNLVGIYNRIRISADNIAKMIRIKNELRGTNKSVFEEALTAEEEQEFNDR